MVRFTQEFKVQCVEKALNRRPGQTLKEVADNLGVGHSTLPKWVRLAKDNKLEKPIKTSSREKSPQDWSKKQRLDAITKCQVLDNEQTSAYCRENGIYPHHLEQWIDDFLMDNQTDKECSKKEHSKLKQENKRLKKELARKEKALAETAALLVLSKKCQAIWGEKEDD